MMREILVSQEYKVNPLSIKVDQTKKILEEMRGIEIIWVLIIEK